MDKKLKAKWVKALRSGSYRQARQELIGKGRAYCCLGVLSRIMNPKTKRTALDYPPYHLIGSGMQRTLANMNDGIAGYEAHDFKQIANFIKANL